MLQIIKALDQKVKVMENMDLLNTIYCKKTTHFSEEHILIENPRGAREILEKQLGEKEVR